MPENIHGDHRFLEQRAVELFVFPQQQRLIDRHLLLQHTDRLLHAVHQLHPNLRSVSDELCGIAVILLDIPQLLFLVELAYLQLIAFVVFECAAAAKFVFVPCGLLFKPLVGSIVVFTEQCGHVLQQLVFCADGGLVCGAPGRM